MEEGSRRPFPQPDHQRGRSVPGPAKDRFLQGGEQSVFQVAARLTGARIGHPCTGCPVAVNAQLNPGAEDQRCFHHCFLGRLRALSMGPEHPGAGECEVPP